MDVAVVRDYTHCRIERLMTFSGTLRATTVALVALTAGVRSLDAQSARLDFGTPSPTTAQIPLSVGIIRHGTSIWRGVLWGAAVGAVAAGAVCATDESCRRNGGVSEDAAFGAALGAAVGGVVVAVARDQSVFARHGAVVARPVVLRVRMHVTA